MEENIINQFEEGLYMFGMNFATTGFSWAEDLYQKLENICQNNIIVQEPAKIVDAVGVQVRKIYDEVTEDWLSSFSLGCDKAPISDLSSELDVTADFCEESRTRHGKQSMSKESLVCPISTLAGASKEIQIVPLPDIERDERKEACDLFSIGCDKAMVSDLSLEQDVMADVCKESGTSCDKEPTWEGSLMCPMSALAIASKEIKVGPLSDTERDEKKETCDLFSIGCDKALVSDLSLERDLMADVCEESRTSHDEEPICEATLMCPMSALAIASKEIKVVPLLDTEKNERKRACELFDKEIARTPPESNICGCPSDIRYSNEKVSNLSNFTSHSGSLPAADNICLPELPENKVEREFILSHFTDQTEEDGKSTSQEGIAFIEPFSTVHEKKSSLSELESSPSITDVGGFDCFNEHKTQYSVIVDKNLESIEEFEDVSLEDFLDEKTLDDCWKEAETYELALISYRAMKNRSYKKKLRDAFTSRFCSPKKNIERGASFSGDIRAELAKMGITSPSLVSSRVSEVSDLFTLESSESDWELL